MTDLSIRSQSWRTLATCFSPPLSEVWDDALAKGSFSCMDPLGNLFRNTPDSEFQAGMSFEDLRQAYSSCFEVGNAPVSFHERTYTKDAASKLFEELFRYYEHFGLDLKNNDNAHWPDSILVELDFMYYLSHLQSIASNEDDVLSLQRGQRDFLKRHLGPLAAGISVKLCAMEVTPYDQLAKVMNYCVNRDRDYLARIVDGVITTST